MSIRSSVHSFVIVASLLASTSVAFARNPPALAQARQSQGSATAASNYRDSSVRFGAAGARDAQRAAGYRDSLTRFAAQAPVRIASKR